MKEQIVETAKDLFLQNGIKKVTLDDIAKALSISKKTLYTFFENKENLVDQSLEMLLKECQEKLIAISSKNLPPVEHLQSVGRLTRGYIKKTNPLFWPELRKYLSHTWEKHFANFNAFFLQYITAIIIKGMSERIFRSDISPEVMARLCLHLIRSSSRCTDEQQQEFLSRQFYVYFISGIMSKDIMLSL